MLDLDLSLESVAVLGAAFSPISITPSAWYDPSDLSTLWKDTAGTDPVTADGDAVARIDDKSGNGNHLIQATAASRPLYKADDGKYLLFDGTDDLLTDLFGGVVTQPLERVSAFRQITWAANQIIFDNGAVGAAGRLSQRTSTPQIALNSGTALNIAGPAIGANGVVTERHNGASSRIAVNNGAYTAGNGGIAVPTGLTIGGDPGATACANFRFYGMVQKFGVALTSVEIAQLRTSLGAKCGLSL